jgi:hypothetical protein
MALPFEGQSTEDRNAERIHRFQRRENWFRDPEMQREFYKFGKGLGHTREMLKDSLLLSRSGRGEM